MEEGEFGEERRRGREVGGMKMLLSSVYMGGQQCILVRLQRGACYKIMKTYGNKKMTSLQNSNLVKQSKFIL